MVEELRGERVLDIHHIDHPAKAYDNSDLICIGFTSHYEAMRARFGDHMEDGIAGENIIIDCQEEIWPDDLGERVMFENKATGRQPISPPRAWISNCRR